MEREKMIDGMENDIPAEMREIAYVLSAGWCRKGKCTENKCAIDDCDVMTQAREVYERFYRRKVPDGAVVIDKGELDALRNDLINAECNLNHVTLQLEEERTRTAREIFNKVIEYLENQQKRYDEEYQKWFSQVTKNKIDNLEIESIREFEMEQYGNSIKANGCRLMTDKAIENIRKIAKEYGVEVEE